jgi:hypothetical protein
MDAAESMHPYDRMSPVPPVAGALPAELANHPDFDVLGELGQGGMGTYVSGAIALSVRGISTAQFRQILIEELPE